MNRTIGHMLCGIALLGALCGIAPAHAQQAYTEHTLTLDHPDHRPAATLDEMAWLVGHFRGEAFGGLVEEVWAPPLGGSMMGMFKLVNDGAVQFYELMTIVEDGPSLRLTLKHFHADLTGWEAQDETVSFPLVKMTPEAAFFEGMTLRRLGPDTVQVFLAVQQGNDSLEEVEFLYYRMPGTAP